MRRALIGVAWIASLAAAALLATQLAEGGRGRVYLREIEMPAETPERPAASAPRSPPPESAREAPAGGGAPSPPPGRDAAARVGERLRQPGLRGKEICELLAKADEAEIRTIDLGALLEVPVSEGLYDFFDALSAHRVHLRDLARLDGVFLESMGRGNFGPRGVANYLDATGRPRWQDCLDYIAGGVLLPRERALSFVHGFDYLPLPPDADDLLRFVESREGVDPDVVSELRRLLADRRAKPD